MFGCASRMGVPGRGRYLLKKLLRTRNNKLHAKNIYMYREDKLIGRKYKWYAKYNLKFKFTT